MLMSEASISVCLKFLGWDIESVAYWRNGEYLIFGIVVDRNNHGGNVFVGQFDWN